MDKQAFLSVKSAVKKVEIPEWNDSVYVKKFSAAERVKFLQAAAEDGEVKAETFIAQMVKLLQICLSDEDGVRVFDDSQEDYEILNSKDSEILENIFNEAMKFNNIGVEEEKAVIKN